MRRYWQPVALSEELAVNRPVPVELLGEKLVLYRDPSGKPVLLGQFCPHRGVDLSYGRVEDQGLRCLYHGWLFSSSGRCLDQPGEPAESTFKDKIKQPAYPCHEANGLILAYLGPGEPPLVPELDFLGADPAGLPGGRFDAFLQAFDGGGGRRRRARRRVGDETLSRLQLSASQRRRSAASLVLASLLRRERFEQREQQVLCSRSRSGHRRRDDAVRFTRVLDSQTRNRSGVRSADQLHHAERASVCRRTAGESA